MNDRNYPSYRILFFVLVGMSLIAVFVTARAETPLAYDAALAEEEIDERIGFIQTRLQSQQRRAQYWHYGWSGFYGLSTLLQTYKAIDEDNADDTANFTVGAVKSAGALALMLLKPNPSVTGSGEVDDFPATNRAQKLQKLKQAESVLQRNALRAEERYSWKRHLLPLAVNLAGGAAIAAFGDEDDVAGSILSGVLISELAIWTEPSRASQDWKDYQARHLAHRADRPDWRLLPIRGGLALHMQF